LKFSIKNKKPLPNIAPVQVSDKNLHPFMYSIFYSIGREREGERERIVPNRECAYAGAGACWEKESEVKGERKFVNAKMVRTVGTI
jgi:hypothetical protein